MKLHVTPVDDDFRADVDAMAAAINPNTAAIVGSAVNFPYGTIDPIDRLGALAAERGIGLHVDGCLGGYLLPWVEKLGHKVPPFDFRVPGVTSMSCDTHKYGYAPKGTSVVLYRGMELRRYQYFTIADWPGGLYYSPTFSGSRPGGLSAACWAALMAMGESGYTEATRRILEAVATMKAGIANIPGMQLLGQTFGAFAFRAERKRTADDRRTKAAERRRTANDRRTTTSERRTTAADRQSTAAARHARPRPTPRRGKD
jgi:glutamate/tyrosine decarboxylase-like PLP-dependent enzyme